MTLMCIVGIKKAGLRSWLPHPFPINKLKSKQNRSYMTSHDIIKNNAKGFKSPNTCSYYLCIKFNVTTELRVLK